MEGLHQLRVAFRRLEVALGAFGKEFDQDWLEELRGRAKILSGRLAPARDLDVFIGKLLASPPKSGVSDGLPQPARPRRERARHSLERSRKPASPAPISRSSSMMSRRLAQSRLPLTRDNKLPRTGAAHAGPPGTAGEKARPRRPQAAKKAICIGCASR